MKACRNIFLIALCILAGQPQRNVVLAAYTMAETCEYYSEGYIANPDNCRGWGYCRGGSLIQNSTCENNLYYDADNGSCNYASVATCRSTTVAALCSNPAKTGFVADPDNCSNYCYCSSGSYQCAACPAGQIFIPSDLSCGYPNGGECATNSICELIPNNKYIADPLTCGYYLCLNGAGTAGSCDTGYTFNAQLGKCDPNISCTPNTNPGTPNTDPSNGNGDLTTNAVFCVSHYDEAKGGTQYFSDDTTCYGYYVCSSTSGSGQWGRCQEGTQYNPTTGYCVTPFTYACPYNRCGNTKYQFVANFGCETYSVCSAGSTVKSGYSCAANNPNYPFFDEYAGGCVASKPAYAICAATPTAPPAPAAPVTK